MKDDIPQTIDMSTERIEDLISNCPNLNMILECQKYFNSGNANVKLLFENQIRLLRKGATNEEKKEAEIHRLKANDCLRKKDQQGAFREFKESLRINPTNPITFSERSLINFVNKNYKEALNDANNSIIINNKFSKGYQRLIDIYYEMKEYKKALIAGTALLEIEPNNSRGKNSILKIKEILSKNKIKIINEDIIDKAKKLLSGDLFNETNEISNMLAKLQKVNEKTNYIYPISLLVIPIQATTINVQKIEKPNKDNIESMFKSNIEKERSNFYQTQTLKDGLLKNCNFALKTENICGLDFAESKDQACKRICEFQEEKHIIIEKNAIVKTSILDKYKKYCPEFKKLNHNNENVQIFKVTLNDNRQFVLKVITTDKEKLGLIYSLLLEFYIGRTFSLICDKVAKTIDMKEIEFGENNSMIRIELLTEYGGESARLLVEQKSITDPVLMGYQLLQILEEMEEYGIAHFDIKPHNIVWNGENNKLKLIDFGTSMTFYLNPEAIKLPLKNDSNLLSGFTRMYAPPELQSIRDKEIAKTIIPHKVDVFCFGMTFAELLMYKNRKELTEGCPVDRKEFNEFIIGLENTLAEIHEGAWIDFVNECLNYDQLRRPNAKELKEKFERILIKENMQYIITPKERTNFIKCIKNAIKMKEWELTILYCNLLKQSIPSTKLNSIETKQMLIYVNRAISNSYANLHITQKDAEYLEKAIKLNEEVFNSKNAVLIFDYFYFGLCLNYTERCNEGVEWIEKSQFYFTIYMGKRAFKLSYYIK